jgi:hypothetical protein
MLEAGIVPVLSAVKISETMYKFSTVHPGFWTVRWGASLGGGQQSGGKSWKVPDIHRDPSSAKLQKDLGGFAHISMQGLLPDVQRKGYVLRLAHLLRLAQFSTWPPQNLSPPGLPKVCHHLQSKVFSSTIQGFLSIMLNGAQQGRGGKASRSCQIVKGRSSALESLGLTTAELSSR